MDDSPVTKDLRHQLVGVCGRGPTACPGLSAARGSGMDRHPRDDRDKRGEYRLRQRIFELRATSHAADGARYGASSGPRRTIAEQDEARVCDRAGHASEAQRERLVNGSDGTNPEAPRWDRSAREARSLSPDLEKRSGGEREAGGSGECADDGTRDRSREHPREHRRDREDGDVQSGRKGSGFEPGHRAPAWRMARTPVMPATLEW